ncbi:heterogeneous nuclear ribonucleoprotein L isoform X2 [Neocloeon triangulifer]|uniref:heterogeneous nuclear ribonucleoprotein L isoform X2 n=1 Tax=Neocloeon triangulifer TaxID=2078957 RepID=UPI00286EDC07|nr:heterogeneous nuclear ribonucleoprotein L isoform X2 [Neocloeon triangulifer]
MAHNGEGPMSKRLRTDLESQQVRTLEQQQISGIGNFIDEPRRKRAESDKLNHVLLFTIINPLYPITVDVLHTISAPNGQVVRIVIFKKNGVQAMVEFDSVESAKRAKDTLNGADIYSGCCTLKIEYAKPSKLNVYRNDSESWDYTVPDLGVGDHLNPQHQPYSGGGGGGGGGGPNRYADEPPYGGGGGGGMPPQNGPRSLQDNYNSDRQGYPPGPPQQQQNITSQGPSNPVPQQGSVMMVYGLNLDKVNPDRLFNIFCLYGNVVRIKFLKTKEGCAMIQLGDSLAVERAVQNLNNVQLAGSKLQLGYSKQAFLSDVQHPYQLPDKSPSFKDFMGNKNNRFINPVMASKNRIQPPSKILHFFNTPPSLTEEQLKEVFENSGVGDPKTIKLFPSKTERSSSGLLEFDSISDALDALMMCNHLPIQNPNGKFPYIMKLCFSSSRQIPSTISGSMHLKRDSPVDLENMENGNEDE